MINDSFENYLDKVLREIEEDDDSRTLQAMRYSLMADGKRLRPRLLKKTGARSKSMLRTLRSGMSF